MRAGTVGRDLLRAALIAALLASCYDTPRPECAFLCGEGSACPDGYECASDGWCKRSDVDPSFVCEVDDGDDDAAVNDAATGDGPTGDAPTGDGGATDAPPGDAADGDAAPPIDAAPPVDAGRPRIDAAPPVDAAPVDAAPPVDAARVPVDASAAIDAAIIPIDAFVNAAPVLSVPVANPLTVTAGDVLGVTVSAMDPDPGQLVTLSATGGVAALDPFTPTAGATFAPGTGQLEFPTGVLGAFDVELRAEDDFTPPGVDAEILQITVAPNPVVINEVRYAPDTAQDIELHNRGEAAVSVAGWRLCVTSTACYALEFATIPADGYKVIHWNQTAPDVDPEYFTGAGLPDLADEGTVALYRSAVQIPRNIMDAVSWNVIAGAHALIIDVVGARQWPSIDAEAEAIAVLDYDAGESLAYAGAGETRAAWSIDPSPTFGTAND
jgi:hypothetical protein